MSLSAGADLIGIDCPLGWPERFADFVAEHRAGPVSAPSGGPIEWRRTLANRVTDLDVRARTGLVPLSVSADRLAHVAFRCAALLAELAAAGVVIDRSGMTGAVAEVYPAATLSRWGMTYRGYKGSKSSARNGPDRRRELVAALTEQAPWLRLAGHRPRLESDADSLDAVIAALTARAVWAGLTTAPPEELRATASVEGWIAVPEPGSLHGLLAARPGRPPRRVG